MAMPSSGCIALITCPNSVACSSIAQAICPGTSTSFACLSDYSIRAGKTATPYCMTEFYSYNPNYVSLLCTGSVGTDGVSTTVNRCHCLVYSQTRTIGNCYCLCLLADLNATSQSGSYAAICVICNAVSKLSCQLNTAGCVSALGVSFLVDYNDTVSMCACASVPTSGIGCARSQIAISIVTPVVGEWSDCGLVGCKLHNSYTV